MTWLALVLVLASAFIHASWNFLLKKSGGGIGLITAASLLSLLVYALLVAIATAIQGYAFEQIHLVLMAGADESAEVYFETARDLTAAGWNVWVLDPAASPSAGDSSFHGSRSPVTKMARETCGVRPPYSPLRRAMLSTSLLATLRQRQTTASKLRGKSGSRRAQGPRCGAGSGGPPGFMCFRR